MRRRDLLAGVLGTGVVAGGAGVAVAGVPSLDRSGTGTDGERGEPEPKDPVEITTLDARGSEAGTLTVPLDDRLTVLSFFATDCASCAEKQPKLAAARDRLPDDEVAFVSVTAQPVGEAISEDEVVEWFESREGDWTLAHDSKSELSVAYNGVPYPKSTAVDATGRVRWEHVGLGGTAELVSGIEGALDAAADPSASADGGA